MQDSVRVVVRRYKTVITVVTVDMHLRMKQDFVLYVAQREDKHMRKKKQVVGLNIFVILVAIAYALIMIIGNVSVAKSSVATISGSYGEQYAIENHLNQVVLADSEQVYFDQRYELFDYNVNDGKITLENYSGKSSDLVIPKSIGGVKITALGENFISSLDTVKNVYLPLNVREILGEVDTNITIHCPENATLIADYEETDWNIEVVYDSDFINFELGDIPFQYNLNEANAEITRYDGNEELVVIPSYINGYPVTTVSMDFLGTAEVIVIPETVTNITGSSVQVLYSPVFMIELIFTIFAFVVALITVNVLLPRYRKNTEEYLLTGNQIVAVILYVVVQTIFGIAATYFLMISAFIALIISLIIIGGFVAILMLGGAGRKHVKKLEAHVAEKTSGMKAIKDSSRNMASEIRNPELRKQVQRLVDEIRFSDAVSRADLNDIESEIEDAIQELKKSISAGDEDAIKNNVECTMQLVKERNIRCKSGK